MIINRIEISCIPKKLFLKRFVSAYHKSRAGKFYTYLFFEENFDLDNLRFGENCLVRGKIVPVPIFGKVVKGIEVDEILPTDKGTEVNRATITVDVEKNKSNKFNLNFFACLHYRLGQKPFPIKIKCDTELPLNVYICAYGYFRSYQNKLTGSDNSYIFADNFEKLDQYSPNLMMTYAMRVIGFKGACQYSDFTTAEEDIKNMFFDQDKNKLKTLNIVAQNMIQEIIYV